MPEERSIKKFHWMEDLPPFNFVEFFRKYRKRITHAETGLPFVPKQPQEYTIEQLAFNTGKGLKIALAIFAPICFIIFGISFFWDPYRILSSCSVAGLIGFGTNWVAIKMLFWPKKARPIFGHGLIPSQRTQLIHKITNEVLDKLINEELIRQRIEQSGILRKLTLSIGNKLQTLTKDPEFQQDVKNLILNYTQKILNDPEFRSHIKTVVSQRLEEFAGNNFKEWLFVKFRRVWHNSFLEVFEKELENLPDILNRVFDRVDIVFESMPKTIEDHKEGIEKALTKMQMGLIQEIDIRSIVMEQLEKVTSEQLEQGFREFSDDKLSYITILGGVLGVLGGFVILWPIWSLLGMFLTILFLYILDHILYRILENRKTRK